MNLLLIMYNRTKGNSQTTLPFKMPSYFMDRQDDLQKKSIDFRIRSPLSGIVIPQFHPKDTLKILQTTENDVNAMKKIKKELIRPSSISQIPFGNNFRGLSFANSEKEFNRMVQPKRDLQMRKNSLGKKPKGSPHFNDIEKKEIAPRYTQLRSSGNLLTSMVKIDQYTGNSFRNMNSFILDDIEEKIKFKSSFMEIGGERIVPNLLNRNNHPLNINQFQQGFPTFNVGNWNNDFTRNQTDFDCKPFLMQLSSRMDKPNFPSNHQGYDTIPDVSLRNPGFRPVKGINLTSLSNLDQLKPQLNNGSYKATQKLTSVKNLENINPFEFKNCSNEMNHQTSEAALEEISLRKREELISNFRLPSLQKHMEYIKRGAQKRIKREDNMNSWQRNYFKKGQINIPRKPKPRSSTSLDGIFYLTQFVRIPN